ncbi:MAG: phosphonate ABC transporter, permease protein PhnE, partial [Variibacter sp.]|nr:phosphonate ABC transporter, permease protein PhnE [Variibacter sp.]
MSAPAADHAGRGGVPANWWRRGAWLALAAYCLYALSTLEITWERVGRGLGHGAEFLARMWPPNVEAQKLELLQQGMVESIQIAILATALGVALSLPLGLLAARNLMPAWLSWIARILIALCRSFHPVIVAILFVKA